MKIRSAKCTFDFCHVTDKIALTSITAPSPHKATRTGGEQRGETPSGGAQLGGELNLYTWDGMFPQEILDGFEKETGIRVRYSNFDYDEDMLAKLEENTNRYVAYLPSYVDDVDLTVVGPSDLSYVRFPGWSRSWTPLKWRTTAT